MKQERLQALRTGRNIGAVMGGLVFLLFGIAPAFYFGSAGTLMLITHLVGPVDPGIIVRGMLVVGTLLGLVCIASVSIVVGSVLGTALAWLTDSVAEAFRPASPEAAAATARK